MLSFPSSLQQSRRYSYNHFFNEIKDRFSITGSLDRRDKNEFLYSASVTREDGFHNPKQIVYSRRSTADSSISRRHKTAQSSKEEQINNRTPGEGVFLLLKSSVEKNIQQAMQKSILVQHNRGQGVSFAKTEQSFIEDDHQEREFQTVKEMKRNKNLSNSFLGVQEAHSFLNENHPHFTTTTDEDIEEQADYEQTKKQLVLISRQQVERRQTHEEKEKQTDFIRKLQALQWAKQHRKDNDKSFAKYKEQVESRAVDADGTLVLKKQVETDKKRSAAHSAPKYMKRILEVVKLSSPPRKNWMKVNNKLFTASMVARSLGKKLSSAFGQAPSQTELETEETDNQQLNMNIKTEQTPVSEDLIDARRNKSEVWQGVKQNTPSSDTTVKLAPFKKINELLQYKNLMTNTPHVQIEAETIRIDPQNKLIKQQGSMTTKGSKIFENLKKDTFGQSINRIQELGQLKQSIEGRNIDSSRRSSLQLGQDTPIPRKKNLSSSEYQQTANQLGLNGNDKSTGGQLQNDKNKQSKPPLNRGIRSKILDQKNNVENKEKKKDRNHENQENQSGKYESSQKSKIINGSITKNNQKNKNNINNGTDKVIGLGKDTQNISGGKLQLRAVHQEVITGLDSIIKEIQINQSKYPSIL